ncbi:MAG: glycine cleavage system protein R [Gammaproteobacteria bacterium]
MENLLAVTAIGPDRIGLVQDLSNAISGAGGNIRESLMSTLGSEFAVIMLVEGNWHAINKIEEALSGLGNEGNLTITVRNTKHPAKAEPAAPYHIDIVAIDQEGIVFNLSRFFASRNLDIAELTTRRYNAPHTGATMFAINMNVNIPAKVHIATLRDEFQEFCDQHNLDAIIEPFQR